MYLSTSPSIYLCAIWLTEEGVDLPGGKTHRHPVKRPMLRFCYILYSTMNPECIRPNGTSEKHVLAIVWLIRTETGKNVYIVEDGCSRVECPLKTLSVCARAEPRTAPTQLNPCWYYLKADYTDLCVLHPASQSNNTVSRSDDSISYILSYITAMAMSPLQLIFMDHHHVDQSSLLRLVTNIH